MRWICGGAVFCRPGLRGYQRARLRWRRAMASRRTRAAISAHRRDGEAGRRHGAAAGGPLSERDRSFPQQHHLHLENGAILLASPDEADFDPYETLAVRIGIGQGDDVTSTTG